VAAPIAAALVLLATGGGYLLGAAHRSGQPPTGGPAAGGSSVNAAGLALGVPAPATVAVPGAVQAGATGVVAPGSSGAPAVTAAGVTVQGLGRVSGTPDTMVVTLGVQVKRGSVTDALSAANGRMASVRDALRRAGVADRDLQTSSLSVWPNYVYAGGTQQLQGYQASESLTATLGDLTKAGAQISAAVSAGGNEVIVGGMNLELRGDSAAMRQARQAAMADAQVRAAQLAAAAGRRLGAVVAVSETVNSAGPMPYAAAARAGVPDAIPIQPGSTPVSVTVTVVYAFA